MVGPVVSVSNKVAESCEKHCFRYPLTITQVRPDSVAASAVVDEKSGLIGLRKGDQIQGWNCSTFGHWVWGRSDRVEAGTQARGRYRI